MLSRARAGKVSFQAGEAELLVNAVRRARRVEVQADEHGLKYVALFDADSYDVTERPWSGAEHDTLDGEVIASPLSVP